MMMTFPLPPPTRRPELHISWRTRWQRHGRRTSVYRGPGAGREKIFQICNNFLCLKCPDDTFVINPKYLWSLGWKPQNVTFLRLKKYSCDGTPPPPSWHIKVWVWGGEYFIPKFTPGFDLSIILIPLSPISKIQGVFWLSSALLDIFITDWNIL